MHKKLAENENVQLSTFHTIRAKLTTCRVGYPQDVLNNGKHDVDFGCQFASHDTNQWIAAQHDRLHNKINSDQHLK